MHRQRTSMVLPVIEAIRSDNMAYTLLSACPHQSVFPPNKLPMTMGGGIGGGGGGVQCSTPLLEPVGCTGEYNAIPDWAKALGVVNSLKYTVTGGGTTAPPQYHF